MEGYALGMGKVLGLGGLSAATLGEGLGLLKTVIFVCGLLVA